MKILRNVGLAVIGLMGVYGMLLGFSYFMLPIDFKMWLKICELFVQPFDYKRILPLLVCYIGFKLFWWAFKRVKRYYYDNPKIEQSCKDWHNKDKELIHQWDNYNQVKDLGNVDRNS